MNRALVQVLGILGLLGVLAATAILVADWNVLEALSSALVHKEG